ncbi:hypothetical protein Tco_0072815 [Tanacetum coccineum]
MLYCFVNNIHVDYAELLWEGLYYSLHHPTSSIPYPRFTKIIVSHYMTIFFEISRRPRDMYHNLQDDDIMKNIFNSGRHKNKVGMQIPAWMITNEIKLKEHYRMYAEVFGIDVPMTQRSTCLTPPAPVLNVDKAYEMILQDTLQISLAEHKSLEEQEAREIVALVDEHLASEEIEKMVDGQENVVDDSSIPRNDESNISGTRIELRSDKESPKVEIAKEKEVEISKEKELDLTSVVIPVNVNDEDNDITDEVYEFEGEGERERQDCRGRYGYLFAHLRARFMPRKSFDTLADNLHDVMVETLPTMVDKHIKEQVMKQVPEQVRNQVPVYVAEGLILERQKAKEETKRLIAKAILQERGNIQAQISTQIKNAIANVIPSQVDASVRSYMYGHILYVHPAQSQTSSVLDQQYQLTPVVRLRDQDDPHDDAHLEGENSNQEQDDDFDFWTDSYASDDDEIPTKQVSQDIMEEVSLTIDEAKLRKMADEMLR